MRTIAIVNQKGGCGKTTTAINLAAVLARQGRRTLLVDMDPQAHCAAGLGVPESSIERSIGDALPADPLDPQTTRGLAWEVSRNFHLIPSTMRLAGLEAAAGGLHQLPDRDRRLAGLLSRYVDRYDWCLIDCPPTIGLLTYNALRAAGEALIPVETGYFALRGAEKQWSTVQHLASRLNREITCRLLPSMHNPQRSLSEQILATLRSQFVNQLAPIVIEEHDAIREAASFGQPVIEYAPGTPAAEQYEDLADWLASNIPQSDVFVEVFARHEDVSNGSGLAYRSGDRDRSPVAQSRATALHLDSHSMGYAAEAGPRPGGRAGELARRVRALRTASTAAGEEVAPDGSAHGDCRPDVAESPDVASPPADSARSSLDGPRLGVTCRGTQVTFAQPVEVGGRVEIAGDFNNWSPARTPLHLDERTGRLTATLDLAPGTYQYRVVIDGRWQADPYNAQHAMNAYGEPNSVLVVGEAQEAPE